MSIIKLEGFFLTGNFLNVTEGKEHSYHFSISLGALVVKVGS
jgi:hypothetical protein